MDARDDKDKRMNRKYLSDEDVDGIGCMDDHAASDDWPGPGDGEVMLNDDGLTVRPVVFP